MRTDWHSGAKRRIFSILLWPWKFRVLKIRPIDSYHRVCVQALHGSGPLYFFFLSLPFMPFFSFFLSIFFLYSVYPAVFLFYPSSKPRISHFSFCYVCELHKLGVMPHTCIYCDATIPCLRNDPPLKSPTAHSGPTMTSSSDVQRAF